MSLAATRSIKWSGHTKCCTKCGDSASLSFSSPSLNPNATALRTSSTSPSSLLVPPRLPGSMAQASTEMIPLNKRQDGTAAGGPGPSSAAGDVADPINSYLRTDDGQSWLAGQLASWDANAKRGVQEFQDFSSSLKTQFEKDVLSKLPAGLPWDNYFARLRQAGTDAADGAPVGLQLQLQRFPQLPSLPSLNSLPPYLLNKYFNVRVRMLVDDNVKRFIKVAALAVPAACVVFEATKHAAIFSVRKATGPLGPVTRWLLHAALPTGFYGPAIGCFLSIKHLLHVAAKNEQKRKEAEEQARNALMAEQAAKMGNFGAYLKNRPKQGDKV